MAVPSTFADLSPTPASNSGLISDATAVNVVDDHLRSVYALIASVYANSGNGWTSPYLPVADPVWTGNLTTVAGRVGIGLTTPATPLSMASGSSLSWGATNYSYVGGDSGTGVLVMGTQATERVRIDGAGNLIPVAQAAPPTLVTNGQMVFNLTSNTNLRISVRGSDGVTRVANLTLT